MKTLFVLAISLAPLFSFAQITVGYNQSNLPFVSVGYEIKERIKPELRIGTDTFFDNIPFEGVFVYDFLNKPDYEFYAGLGVRSQDFTGLVVPIGLSFYPLANSSFGFNIELAPIIGESTILRGSGGIRYKFKGGNTED